MFRQLKRLTIQLMSGANIATVAVMALVGMSDRLSPADHPLLSVVGLTFPFFIICNFAFLVFWLMFYKRGTLIPLIGFILCYFPHTHIFAAQHHGRHARGRGEGHVV